jgi:predicted nuclease of predicted toxin-antitoxin system
MRVLIDECLDWRLKREFQSHTTATVGEMGWGGTKNGALLTLAQTQFDVFITADKNLIHQQNVVNLTLAIVVLDVASTRLADCLPAIPQVLALLPHVTSGSLHVVHP